MLLLLACAAPDVTGVLPMNDGDDFFDRPFPDDARRSGDHPDLDGFPEAGAFPLLDRYLAESPVLDGFGTSAPLFVRFTGPIDPALLPTPQQSRSPRSPVLLVNVDPQSPWQGEIIPVQFSWLPDPATFLPGNLLSVLPVPGFPMRPGATYALLLRQPVAAPGAQELDWDSPALQSVAATLRSLDQPPEDISLAVTFTTQDPLADMRRISEEIHTRLGLPGWELQLETVAAYETVRVYQGHITVPIWQHGQRPYREQGGGFEFDADGTPLVYAWERIRFAVTVPAGEPPPGGWPVLLYGHGTGGDYLSFARSATDEGFVMARHGVAMIGFSQPLHYDRATPDTQTELDSFNYFNPTAGRTNFRQGALDHVFLAEMLTSTPPTFQTADGPLPLDPDRVGYFGHSQGGLTGAIAAPFMSQDIVVSGFSGAGGFLSLTLALRKDPFDIQATVESLLGFQEIEVADPFHPAVGLIQMFAEATDPLNYAPYWFSADPEAAGRPVPVVLTEGLLDDYTPSVTSEALAAAGRLPIIGEEVSEGLGLQLRGEGVDRAPVEGNVQSWIGPISAGVGQFAEDGHFAIYDNREAEDFYSGFMERGVRGEAGFE